MANKIMRFFAFGHLREGLMRDTSALFYDLARTLEQTLPNSDEKDVALRKLLESKDAAVRAALPPEAE
jgi:hypothetical protein